MDMCCVSIHPKERKGVSPTHAAVGSFDCIDGREGWSSWYWYYFDYLAVLFLIMEWMWCVRRMTKERKGRGSI
jgi:hypothetical protein